MSINRIVVTGMGVISPLGLDLSTTWAGLLSGYSGIAPINSFDASEFRTKIAAEVKGFDPIDYMELKESRRMDRFSQFAVAASRQALSQARIDLSGPLGERTAVTIGSGVGGIITLSEQYDVLANRGPSRISPFLIPKMLVDMAGGQVSITLGAKGPNYCTVTACATGGDSIGHGVALLRGGITDVVIAGGTEAPICPIAIGGFNACNALSVYNENPQKASRPFDANRDGFVIGEGAGILVLETLDHALSRNAEPLVELIGYGATSDAAHITQPAPFGEGGARAMKVAMKMGGVGVNDVDYLNAHGTSTPMNDKFETEGIKSVFGDHAYKMPISSTKSMTGHLLGAAGAIEAAFAVMAITENIIPPTINLENPDKECDLDYVPNHLRKQAVNVAMSNSLGFGGHNAVLLFKRFVE
jgi:3-oxoacyl-[acyl-carrier-protein] synthase II